MDFNINSEIPANVTASTTAVNTESLNGVGNGHTTKSKNSEEKPVQVNIFIMPENYTKFDPKKLSGIFRVMAQLAVEKFLTEDPDQPGNMKIRDISLLPHETEKLYDIIAAMIHYTFYKVMADAWQDIDETGYENNSLTADLLKGYPEELLNTIKTFVCGTRNTEPDAGLLKDICKTHTAFRNWEKSDPESLEHIKTKAYVLAFICEEIKHLKSLARRDEQEDLVFLVEQEGFDVIPAAHHDLVQELNEIMFNLASTNKHNAMTPDSYSCDSPTANDKETATRITRPKDTDIFYAPYRYIKADWGDRETDIQFRSFGAACVIKYFPEPSESNMYQEDIRIITDIASALSYCASYVLYHISSKEKDFPMPAKPDNPTCYDYVRTLIYVTAKIIRKEMIIPPSLEKRLSDKYPAFMEWQSTLSADFTCRVIEFLISECSHFIEREYKFRNMQNGDTLEGFDVEKAITIIQLSNAIDDVKNFRNRLRDAYTDYGRKRNIAFGSVANKGTYSAKSREGVKRDPVQEKCMIFMKEWNPVRIVEFLNETISGQQEAKQIMARMCYEHIARIAHPEIKIPFNNYVMFGPTGCGKTEMCRQLKQILPVPLEIVDASAITQNGYKGNDKEEILFTLYENNKDITRGIIVLDEFDKLCYPSYTSKGENVNRNIQNEMLKMIEGTTLYKSDNKRETDSFDTHNITFLCGGSFDGAFEEEWTPGLGFGAVKENLTTGKSVTECLIDFGMVPELAGRIVTAIPFRALSKEKLTEIMKEKKDSCICHQTNLFKIAYDTDLRFEEEAFEAIAEKAISSGLGARALNGIVSGVCNNLLPEGGTLTVTGQMIDDMYTRLNGDKDSYNRKTGVGEKPIDR